MDTTPDPADPIDEDPVPAEDDPRRHTPPEPEDASDEDGIDPDLSELHEVLEWQAELDRQALVDAEPDALTGALSPEEPTS